MARVRWEPFEGLTSLRREMHRLFENFFERGPFMHTTGEMFKPAVELADTNGNVLVKVQVPGVTKDNLQVDIVNDVLTLRGEIKEEEEKEEKNYYCRELHYGTFSRSISLPTHVQADQATAQLQDGTLTITIPKSEEAKAKQIPIRT